MLFEIVIPEEGYRRWLYMLIHPQSNDRALRAGYIVGALSVKTQLQKYLDNHARDKIVHDQTKRAEQPPDVCKSVALRGPTQLRSKSVNAAWPLHATLAPIKQLACCCTSHILQAFVHNLYKLSDQHLLPATKRSSYDTVEDSHGPRFRTSA
jgi:hypothetical protein